MNYILRLMIFLVLLTTASAAHTAEGEYQVKAAMLFNFAKFVEWPADAIGSENRIVFCIAGKNPLSTSMHQMQGKQMKGRTVTIRSISRPEEAAGCQILFISSSEHSHLSSYLHIAGRYSILTVSDLDRFASSGGMIGFYEEESKVRFETNLEAAQRRRLQISSHLLSLARRVK